MSDQLRPHWVIINISVSIVAVAMLVLMFTSVFSLYRGYVRSQNAVDVAFRELEVAAIDGFASVFEDESALPWEDAMSVAGTINVILDEIHLEGEHDQAAWDKYTKLAEESTQAQSTSKIAHAVTLPEVGKGRQKKRRRREKKLAVLQWGDVWLRLELNKALKMKMAELNAKMPGLVREQIHENPVSENEKVMAQHFLGMDTLKFDYFEATSIHSNLTRKEAEVIFFVSMSTGGQLKVGGKVAAKGDFTYEIIIEGFSGEAPEIFADLDYKRRIVNAAWVDRLNCDFKRARATCYDDYHEEDTICTWFMNLKLGQEKHAFLKQLSFEVRQVLRSRLNQIVPLRLEP
jgi:hypothetical protein